MNMGTEIVLNQGQMVNFDFGNGIKGIGTIEVKSTTNLNPLWIVRFFHADTEGIDPVEYPYGSIVVPQSCLEINTEKYENSETED